jgi:hypothetical protein
LARELGVLGGSIFFPYGIIEGEPTFPLTNLNFPEIRRALHYTANSKGLEGTMANSQTFLMQLPNIYYFTHFGWSAKSDTETDHEVLESLEKLLFPEKADLLADAWAQLEAPGSQPARAIAARIAAWQKSGRLGRLGTLGGHVFPQPSQVCADLVTMLGIHASAERVREVGADAASPADVQAAVVGYLRAMLDWQRQNGFFGAYGVGKRIVYDNFVHGSDAKVVREALKKFAGEGTQRQELQTAVRSELTADGYNQVLLQSFTGELFGTYQASRGEIEKKIFLRLPPPSELAPWAQR